MAYIDFGDGLGPVQAYRHTNPDGTIGGWVATKTRISPNATIGKFARVGRGCMILDYAQILGSARILAGAMIVDSATIKDAATVSGEVIVGGFAQIYDRAKIRDHVQVRGNAIVCGDTAISGGIEVGGYAILRNMADYDRYVANSRTAEAQRQEAVMPISTKDIDALLELDDLIGA